MTSIKVSTGLMNDHQLPEGFKIIWDNANPKQVSHAAKVFETYLQEGWMAFNDSEKGNIQIFKFDANLAKIILVPPLGGG